MSEVGGGEPTGKSFRFVSCVRAVCLSSQNEAKTDIDLFPFPFLFFFGVSLSFVSFVRWLFLSAVSWLVRWLVS